LVSSERKRKYLPKETLKEIYNKNSFAVLNKSIFSQKLTSDVRG